MFPDKITVFFSWKKQKDAFVLKLWNCFVHSFLFIRLCPHTIITCWIDTDIWPCFYKRCKRRICCCFRGVLSEEFCPVFLLLYNFWQFRQIEHAWVVLFWSFTIVGPYDFHYVRTQTAFNISQFHLREATVTLGSDPSK